jgi:hypothetical protein
MKPAAAVFLTLGMVVAGCVPYPVYVSSAPAPLIADSTRLRECAQIRRELAEQQQIAAYSGVMNTWLVQGAVLMNVSTVVSGLQTRAAISGCPI